ncbi:hypothetical protein ACI5FR_19120 [Paenibacillus sp. HJGM_3]
MKGITKEPFPTPFGPSAVLNFVAGWGMLVLAALFVHWADVDQHPTGAIVFGGLGVLLMGLFHTAIGAFGRKE